MKNLFFIGLFLSLLFGLWGLNYVHPRYSSNSPQIQASDSITLPPTVQRFFSPQKNYLFVIENKDQWQTATAQGTLYQIIQQKPQHLWSRNLPHLYSPHYILVGNKGQVLWVDEWINRPSSYALMLLDAKNNLIFQYTFEEIAQLIKTAPDQLVSKAKYGTWMVALLNGKRRGSLSKLFLLIKVSTLI